MRHRVWLMGLCALFLFGTACQPADEGRQAERSPQMTAHRFNRDDGYNGITHANPNMRVGDWYTPTKSEDARRVKELVRGIPGVRNATVIVAGGRLLLGIVPDSDMGAERYSALKREVRDRVRAAFPRYEVNVTINPRSRFRLPLRGGSA
ncbi:MAG: YhcN/YlaJ family sporulation lipoprotein [Planifilum sp.]